MGGGGESVVEMERKWSGIGVEVEVRKKTGSFWINHEKLRHFSAKCQELFIWSEKNMKKIKANFFLHGQQNYENNMWNKLGKDRKSVYLVRKSWKKC